MGGIICDPAWVEVYQFRLSNGSISDLLAGRYGNSKALFFCVCQIGTMISILLSEWLSKIQIKNTVNKASK